jgi:hypothetical protein
MSTATEPLHLVRLDVSNFLRVEALTIDAQGKHVVISGRNTAGKTSAIEALWAAIKGVSKREVPEPIRHGASKASITADVGEYVITRHWTDSGTRLVVKCADGSRVNQAQDLLNGLLSSLSLDPVAFREQRPQDQVDAVLELAGVAPQVDKVAKIAGERLPVHDGESASTYLERLSADERGEFYIRRREAHRVTLQKEAAMQEGRKSLEALGGPLRDGDCILQASKILEQIEELSAVAIKRNDLNAVALDATRELRQATEKLADLQNRKADKIKAIDAVKLELQKLERECAEINARIVKGGECIAEMRTEEEQAIGAAAAIENPEPQIAELRAKVRQSEVNNQTIGKRQLAQEQLQRLGGEYEGAMAEHSRLDTILANLRDLRAHLLDDVDLGVPGLSIGDGGLRLNDVPFVQASTAEKLTISCAMAFRQNPRLKLCRVDNAEHLDTEHRLLLLNLATAKGWQVIMAAVSNTAELQVEIVEPGEVVDAEFERDLKDATERVKQAEKKSLFEGSGSGPYKDGA